MLDLPPAVPDLSAEVVTAGDAAVREFATDVLVGLTDRPRWLPCRYLYDARGSELFDAICTTPEYYPTRTESAILEASAPAIAALTGPATLVELGSGSATKTGHLLAAYGRGRRPVRYVPVDVSAAALRAAHRMTTTHFPLVQFDGVHGTYDAIFPRLRELSPALLVFLGSTIGNLNQGESADFWRKVATGLAPGDHVLLGVDLVKDRATIDAAYNDAAGYSAAFTRNIFARMNRELGAGLDLRKIGHVAAYSPAWQRVEIFARFETPQTLTVAPLGRSVEIGAGEMIMTEISRKFVLTELAEYLECFGFELVEAFTDPRRWFGVLLLRNRGA